METEQRADGTLSDKPLPALLSEIAADELTGVLRIDDGSELWFSTGRTYLACTPSSPKVADVLFSAEAGTEDEIAAALGLGTDRNGSVGLPEEPRALDVLATANPESEGPLRRILHEHNLNSLFELLVPTEATYRFEHIEVHALGDRFAEPTDELLEKAQARLEIWRSIAVRIPSTSAVFRLATSLPDSADQRLVTSDEWRFISLLDGRNDVAKLIEDTGESAFRVCSTLYRLLLEGLVEETAAAEAE